jgi:hypothetical protein
VGIAAGEECGRVRRLFATVTTGKREKQGMMKMGERERCKKKKRKKNGGQKGRMEVKVE